MFPSVWVGIFAVDCWGQEIGRFVVSRVPFLDVGTSGIAPSSQGRPWHRGGARPPEGLGVAATRSAWKRGSEDGDAHIDQRLRASVRSRRQPQWRVYARISTFADASSAPRLPVTPSPGCRRAPGFATSFRRHKERRRSGASTTAARRTPAGRPSSSSSRLWRGQRAGSCAPNLHILM